MGEKRLVLENRRGQIIRTYRWDARTIALVKRHDTGRIEAHKTTDDLEESGIGFDLLVETTPSAVRTQPVELANGGRLIWTDRMGTLSPSVQPQEDDPRQYREILKWTAMGQSAAVALILLLGLAIFPLFEEEELVVTIKPREEVIKPVQKEKVQVVKAAKKKIRRRPRVVKKRKVVNRKVRTPKAKKYAKHSTKRPTRKTALRRSVNVRKMGALGALGGTKNGLKGSRGLNLRAAGKGSGAGLSGTGGSGGIYKTVATNGLISGPVGSGKGKGAGGYGTRGKGGGRSGYGKMSMAGASNGYSQPLYEEALIEGGLDRDQIAAVINRHLGQVIYCYEKGLQKSPKLRGRISVRFVIGGNGRVRTAGLANSSLHNAKVEGCIICWF